MLLLLCLPLSVPVVEPSPEPLGNLLKAIWRYEDDNMTTIDCNAIQDMYAACCEEEGGCKNCPWMHECMKDWHASPLASPLPAGHILEDDTATLFMEATATLDKGWWRDWNRSAREEKRLWCDWGAVLDELTAVVDLLNAWPKELLNGKTT